MAACWPDAWAAGAVCAREPPAPRARDPSLRRDPAVDHRARVRAGVGVRHHLDAEEPDLPAPARRRAVGVGGMPRPGRLLRGLVHARLELPAGAAVPLPRPRAGAARDRVRQQPRSRRAHAVPHAAPAGREGPARPPRRGRRAARRRAEALPGMADLGRRRVARAPLARGEGEPRVRVDVLGPRPRRRHGGAAAQHLRHRVLGAEHDVRLLLPRRAARGRAHQPAPRRPRVGRPVPRGLREGPGLDRREPLERRVLRAARGPGRGRG